jgi:hypothetical protein
VGFGAAPLFSRFNSQSRSRGGVAYQGPFRVKHMKGKTKGSKKKKHEATVFFDEVFSANEKEFKIDKTRLH